MQKGLMESSGRAPAEQAWGPELEKKNIEKPLAKLIKRKKHVDQRWKGDIVIYTSILQRSIRKYVERL
jgi:hypothetical protein